MSDHDPLSVMPPAVRMPASPAAVANNTVRSSRSREGTVPGWWRDGCDRPGGVVGDDGKGRDLSGPSGFDGTSGPFSGPEEGVLDVWQRRPCPASRCASPSRPRRGIGATLPREPSLSRCAGGRGVSMARQSGAGPGELDEFLMPRDVRHRCRRNGVSSAARGTRVAERHGRAVRFRLRARDEDHRLRTVDDHLHRRHRQGPPRSGTSRTDSVAGAFSATYDADSDLATQSLSHGAPPPRGPPCRGPGAVRRTNPHPHADAGKRCPPGPVVRAPSKMRAASDDGRGGSPSPARGVPGPRSSGSGPPDSHFFRGARLRAAGAYGPDRPVGPHGSVAPCRCNGCLPDSPQPPPRPSHFPAHSGEHGQEV